jgi:hypothetical protein
VLSGDIPGDVRDKLTGIPKDRVLLARPRHPTSFIHKGSKPL